MFDDVSLKQELKTIKWKNIRDGIHIGHFVSSASVETVAAGFGPAQIYVKKFEPRKKVGREFTLFFLHDLCQYHGRFTHFIEWVREHMPGVTCIALDFAGHGLSSGTRGQINSFDYLVKDIHNLLDCIEKKEDEKWIVLGHGMGGLVALDLINRYQESAGKRIDGMILSNFILKFQSIFLEMEEQINSEKNILKKILGQSRPSLFYSGIQLLTDSLDILTYDQDPLIIHRPTLNSIRELQKKTQTIYQDSYFIDRPLLLLKSVMGNTFSTEGMDFFSKGIKKDLLCEKKYSLMKHDLYNERDKEIVYNDISSWMKTHES